MLGRCQLLPGLCQGLGMFDWDVAQPGGGSRPPSALPVLLAATAELPIPLRASTALDKAPQAAKAAPVSHLRIPEGHPEQEHPSTALQEWIPSPQHRNTRVWLWKLKMQSGVTCKLDSNLAPAMLGKHRGHPALPVAALLLPHGRAGARGMSGEKGLVCTGCAGWICCDTTSRAPVFIWFLYNFSPEQTPDQSIGRSKKQSRREPS